MNKKRSARLAKRPVLTALHNSLLDAFLELSRRRQFGMSELPLTLEAITKYAEIFRFDDDVRYFFRAMSAMDDEYLIYRAQVRETENAKGNDKSSASRRRSKKS